MQLRTAVHSGGCFLVKSMCGEKIFSPYAFRLQQRLISKESLVVKKIGAVSSFSSQLIAALVKRMTGVALDPLETYLMVFHGGKQTLPKINVFDRLF